MMDKVEYSWEGEFKFPAKLPGRVVPFTVPLNDNVFSIPFGVDVGTWESLEPPAPHGKVRVTLIVEKLR